MDALELKKRYAATIRDFNWAELSGADLAGMTLADAQLNRAKLAKARLEGANLARANLTKAALQESNLRDTLLENGILHKANLTGAALERANLTGADLSQGILAGAKLTGANLEGANLEGADLRDADLRQANLYRAKLNRANLAGAMLEEANLEETEMADADFSDATMPDGTNYEAWATLHPSVIKPEIPEEPELEESESEAEPELAKSELKLPPPPMRKTQPQATFSGFAPVRSPLLSVDRIKRLAEKKGDRQLFLLLLTCLFFGYLGVGMELAYSGAGWFSWLLAWGGSIFWGFNDIFTWFAPLAAGLAVMGSIQISIIVYAFMGIALLVSVTNMMSLGMGVRNSVRDGVWLGITAGLVFATFRGYFSLIFILSIVAITLGTPLWIVMDYSQFGKKQALQVMGGTSGLGLLLGALLVFLLNY